MGNGAKAAQKRERNKDHVSKGSKSQRITNAAAKTIICSICRHEFFITTRLPALLEHVQKRHTSNTIADCFPNYKDPDTKQLSKVKGLEGVSM